MSTSTQQATNSHLTHQPSPVTHLHCRTQHRHHTAPHCTTACTALRTRKPYRSIESFLFEPSFETFLFYFFRTIKARAQDLSRMQGLCTLVILRSATGPQTDFRQAGLFQSDFLFALHLLTSLRSIHWSIFHCIMFLLFFILPWYRLYIPLHLSPKWPPLVFLTFSGPWCNSCSVFTLTRFVNTRGCPSENFGAP